MKHFKIVAFAEVSDRAKQLRDAGKKLVATNGCFDLLHVGHVRYLQRARSLGDLLVVGVNADASVRALKGEGRPINREHDRAEVLAGLESVGLVTIFPQMRATHFIQAVQPDVYVKGGDYTSDTLDAEERALLERLGAKVDIVPFEQGYSTSELLNKLRATVK
jgi:rfaE bifunctional protein nucleotidyltransferase chain/domain